MNDNQSSHTVPLRLFAQNLVQRLEQLNNVDQFTDSSNLALPFALFQLCQINLSVTTSIDAAAARRPPLPTPAGRRPRNAPTQIERRAARGFVACKA
jgi:hypothetical protein